MAEEALCGSIHPKELEWHCECKLSRHHPGNHKCYGCGFEWKQGDEHSRMPDETDDTLLDVLGMTRLRVIRRDGENQWQLKCPGCDVWADIDDDQLHGRVSVEHSTGCGYHETVDWFKTLNN